MTRKPLTCNHISRSQRGYKFLVYMGFAVQLSHCRTEWMNCNHSRRLGRP